jgi:UDPglucose 6-dehydrogenase
MQECRKEYPQITYCRDPYDAAEGAEVLVIATEWNEFRALEWNRLKGLLVQPLVVDLRNLYKPSRMVEEGFRYISIGRPEVGEHLVTTDGPRTDGTGDAS